MALCLNVEPQTGNRKPRLWVRSKLGSKTLYYQYINLLKLTIPDLRHFFRLFNLLVTVTPFITQVKCCEGF